MADDDAKMCGGVSKFLRVTTPPKTKGVNIAGKTEYYGIDDVPGLVDYLAANREEHGPTIWCPSKRCYPTDSREFGYCEVQNRGGKSAIVLEVRRTWWCKHRRPGGGYDVGDDKDPEGGGTASTSVEIVKPPCPGADGRITIVVTISGATNANEAFANASAAAQDAYKNTASGQGKLCDEGCKGVWKDGTPFAEDPPALPDAAPKIDADEEGNGTYTWTFEFSCEKVEGLKYLVRPPGGPGASVQRSWSAERDVAGGSRDDYLLVLAAFAARQSGATVRVVVSDRAAAASEKVDVPLASGW